MHVNDVPSETSGVDVPLADSDAQIDVATAVTRCRQHLPSIHEDDARLVQVWRFESESAYFNTSLDH
jgi:hypothetical protein